MIKILLDTDIGNDIDDSIALTYLLARPDCELLGITTVRPGGAHRCALVREVAAAWNTNVEVVAGSEKPLPRLSKSPLDGRYNPVLDWATDFPTQRLSDDLSDSLAEDGECPVEFMREIINANPGEVTLLGIGPMTNIARLFTQYPETPGLLKQFVTMSGHFVDGFEPGRLHYEFTEWNVRADPAAAAVVYAADVPSIHVGVDVTKRVELSRERAELIFSAPAFLPIRNYLDTWFSEREFITLHDILAAAVIFEPQLCEYQNGDIEVEQSGAHMSGFTYFFPRKDAKHSVAEQVCVERFFSHFESVITSTDEALPSKILTAPSS